MGFDSAGDFVELSASSVGAIAAVGLHRDPHNWDECQALCEVLIDSAIYMPNVSLYYALGIPNEAQMDNIRVVAIAGSVDSEIGPLYFDGIVTEWTGVGAAGGQYEFRHLALTGLYESVADRDYASATRCTLLENNLRLGIQALGLVPLPNTHNTPIHLADYVPRRVPNELSPNTQSDGLIAVDPLLDSLLGGEWGTVAAWSFFNQCTNYLSVCQSCPCAWASGVDLVQGITNVGVNWVEISDSSISWIIPGAPEGCPGDIWRNRLTVTFKEHYGLGMGRLGIALYTRQTIVMHNEASMTCAPQ